MSHDRCLPSADASDPKFQAPDFKVYPVGDRPTANYVNVLYEDHTGRLWAGTNDGLYFLEEVKDGVTVLRVNLGLAPHQDRSVEVAAVIEDREGSLWISTSLGLLRRLPDCRTHHFRIEPAPTNNYNLSLLEDPEAARIAQRLSLIGST